MRCDSWRQHKGFCFPVKPTANLCLFFFFCLQLWQTIFAVRWDRADSCDLSEFEMHHSKLYSCFCGFGKSQQLFWWARLYSWPDPSLLQLTMYLLCSVSLGHVLAGIWGGVSFLALPVWCSVCFLMSGPFLFPRMKFFSMTLLKLFSMPHFLLCPPLVNFSIVCYPKVRACSVAMFKKEQNCHWLWMVQCLYFAFKSWCSVFHGVHYWWGFPLNVFICPTVFYIFLIILVSVSFSISASLLNSNSILWIGFFISYSGFCSSGKIYPSELCICNFM